MRRSVVVATFIAVAGVGVGAVLLVLGWPDSTPAQRTMLTLAQLPIALGAAAPVVQMLTERRIPERNPDALRKLLLPAAVAFVLGLLAVLVGVATVPVVAQGGQFVMWLALGAVFIFLAVDTVRRERAALSMTAVPGEDEWDDRWDDDEDDISDLDDEHSDGFMNEFGYPDEEDDK